MILTRQADPVPVPGAPEATWVRRLLWVFILSFCLDYRAESARDSAGLDQLFFLALALGSTAGIALIGLRHIVVRPGFWLIALWGGFLAFMLANAFVQGVPPGRSLRIIFPLCLCFAGLLNTHIAACMGVRPAHIVAPVLIAACTNILWRLGHGLFIKGVSLETSRVEIQSSANNWIAAFIGCSILLRQRIHWTLFLAISVLFTGVIVTVTRSLLLPVMASAAASSLCFFLGMRWGVFRASDGLKRTAPIGILVILVVMAVTLIAVTSPTLIERWDERLFHHISERNLSQDISITTRQAEAAGIFEILNKDKIHYLYGRGIGESYYWDTAYLPEVHQVLPKEMNMGEEVWFAGHSTWTYALFSGGAIAVLAHLLLLGGVMISSITAARANASDPGPDYWLAFLPFVAACCLLSETATSNPFDERLAALIFGVMAGLPQAFMVRASWIHSSSAEHV